MRPTSLWQMTEKVCSLIRGAEDSYNKTTGLCLVAYAEPIALPAGLVFVHLPNNFSLMVRYAVSLGKLLPTFRRIVSPSSVPSCPVFLDHSPWTA